jgi:regulator of sigma E protease
VRESGGRPLEAEFRADDGRRVTLTLAPRPALMMDKARMGPADFTVLEHLMGLTPVMRVDPEGGEDNEGARRQGLKDGDVFARIGTLEYPSVADGIAEVRRHRGRPLPVSVLRDGRIEDLTVRVSRQGRIGLRAGDTAETSTLLARTPEQLQEIRAGAPAQAPAAAALNLRPGSRLLAVDGRPASNFGELRAALREATREALGVAAGARVLLRVELPLPPQGPGRGSPIEDVPWTIPAEQVRRLHELSWESPLSVAIFEPEQVPLKAGGPLAAVRMGLEETHRVMLTTYVTFARLFQGTVRVEHLKGPVGIAHIGTRIAERGLIWLLFFLALISVNLAVVNFLPLPIVDGGQFLFLVFEQVRGRPVPLAVQNAATAAGLLLIGALFLIVTYNDIANLFGG